jgi:hypothetical protein
MFNFPIILFKLSSLFVNKYYYSASSFTLTFHGRLLLSPLIPCNVKFAQLAFIEGAAFEERVHRAGRVFTALPFDDAACGASFMF